MKEYLGLVERDYRRNLSLFLLVEVAWGIGMGFGVLDVTVPAYLSSLNAPKTLIGIIQSAGMTFVFLQLFSSFYLGGRNRKRNSARLFIIGSACLALAGIICLVWKKPAPYWLSVYLFSLFILLFVIILSSASPLYLEILTDNIPRGKRGNYFGIAWVILGGLGLLFSYVAVFLTKLFGSPANYYLRFLAAGILYASSCLVVLKINDHLNPVHSQEIQQPEFLSETKALLTKVLQNPNYRIFIFFYTFISIALAIGISFIIPYGRDYLSANEQQISVFFKVWFLTALFGCIPLGKLGDRSGYRAVGILMSGLLLLGYIAILTTKNIKSLPIAYIPFCLATQASVMLLNNLGVEFCEDIKPSSLFSVGSLIPIPFVFGIIILCGQIIDIAKNYLAVFLIGAAFSAVGLAGFWILLREPRKGLLFVIEPVNRG